LLSVCVIMAHAQTKWGNLAARKDLTQTFSPASFVHMGGQPGLPHTVPGQQMTPRGAPSLPFAGTMLTLLP